jgi:hypothetical protein
MVHVKVYQNDELLGETQSNNLSFFLGKDAESLVPLKGWRIGRRQVLVEHTEGGIYVSDGGGFTPIKINGRSISEYGPVSKDDLIEIGDYRIQLEANGAPRIKSTSELALEFAGWRKCGDQEGKGDTGGLEGIESAGNRRGNGCAYGVAQATYRGHGSSARKCIADG